MQCSGFFFISAFADTPLSYLSLSMRILAIIACLLLIVSCFFPWVTIESKNIVITGIETEGTNFGKPAYMHFLWASLVIIFLLLKKGWAHKMAIFFAALNLGWALRNFFIIPMCRGGECPEKHIAIYLVLLFTVLIVLFSLLIPAPVYKEDDM